LIDLTLEYSVLFVCFPVIFSSLFLVVMQTENRLLWLRYLQFILPLALVADYVALTVGWFPNWKELEDISRRLIAVLSRN